MALGPDTDYLSKWIEWVNSAPLIVTNGASASQNPTGERLDQIDDT